MKVASSKKHKLMVYNKSQLDYQKAGTWKQYDESGNETSSKDY